ncbi:MAG: electron transport complex subunit RsxG [Vibrionaceae bacterium]
MNNDPQKTGVAAANTQPAAVLPEEAATNSAPPLWQQMAAHSTTLALSALLCTALVSVTYLVCAPLIQKAQEEQHSKLLENVLPRSFYNNALEQSCLWISDPRLSKEPVKVYVAKRDDEPVALITQAVAPDGYSGAIKLLLAVDLQNTLLGISVLEHHETPGLGDKIDRKISKWLDSLQGKTLQSENDTLWQVKKDGGQFDQFTGATITPRAVINATRRAIWTLHERQSHILAQQTRCGLTNSEANNG